MSEKQICAVWDQEEGIFKRSWEEPWAKANKEKMREAQNAQQIASIKGRFQHLNIEWTPEIEQHARKVDGGGITAYLLRVELEQQEAREQARKAVPGYGKWA